LVAKPSNRLYIEVTVTAQYDITSEDVPSSITHVRVEQTGFVGSEHVLADTVVSRMDGGMI
jgi:hypothetical protein